MNGVQEELPLEQVVSDLFRDFKGDEAGGQHASRGFNFQVWHAVLEALKAYKTGDDYAVVLEWQQDVAVLNSSIAPTMVRFVQLKKHETATHWKLHHLVDPNGDEPAAANDVATQDLSASDPVPPVDATPEKVKKKTKTKKPKQSFLAKLYAHRRRFKSLAKSRLEFASNAKFEIPDAAGGKAMLSSFELTGLDSAVREGLEAKVRSQLAVPADEAIDLSDFGLLVSECPINDPHKHVAGELAEMQMGSELQLSGAATMLAVLIIASYVHQRAGSTSFAKDLNELLKRGVTRSDIDGYLSAANDAQVSTEEQVQEVIARVNAELAPFAIVSNMKRELSRACIDITNRAGAGPMVAARLKALYLSKLEYQHHPKVIDIFSEWYDDFLKIEPNGGYLHKREYLYCLMSMIIQNANPTQQLPSVPLGSQPEDEE